MKKIYSLILVAASLAVAACQPKELDIDPVDVKPDVKSVKITATIEDIDATKVRYNISDKAIKPAWEEGDELFGFDANGGKFTYVVKYVDENTGEATIEPKPGTTSYTPEVGTAVYGIYYPGKGVDDISSDGALAIDLAGQSGTLGTLSPAIMCATATVTGGTEGNEIRFKFLNQTAIIGLKKIQLGTDAAPVASATIDQIAIEGVVTHGSLSVEGGQLTLTPGTKTSTVYAVPAESSWVTDDKGQIDFGSTSPVAFAVLPSTHVPTVYAYTSTAAFKNNKAVGSKEMAAGHYYYMSKKLDASAEPVASLTVGGVTSKYFTIDAAFDAADCSNANSTITLLKNCGASSQLKLTNSAVNGAVTLDLNGCTLSGSSDDHCLYVVGRTLTIKDSGTNGIIESAASSKYPLYLGAGANVTLNTGTITHSVYRAIRIDDSGNFTMNGGTVSAADGNYGIALAGSGDIRVTGGSISGSRAISYINLTGGTTFTGNLSVGGGTLEGKSSYGISITDGEINVSGGTISGSYGINATGGKINVSGGTISGNSSNAVASADTVDITGGTFTSTSTTSSTIYISGANAVGTISGGLFNSNALSTVAASSGGTAYVTGGIHSRAVQVKYAVDDNDGEYVNILNTDNDTKATYPFAVGSATSYPAVDSVAQGTNYWKHASVEGAFINANQRAAVAAGTGTVITQLADATASATLNVNDGNVNGFTLDLNGYTVSAKGVSPLITTASDFTLTDSSEGGAGELNTTGNVALSVTAGTTTINSGSLVGATSAVSVAAGATLTVNNGYFFGAENGVDVAGADGATVSLAEGCWFRNEPLSAYLATGTAAQEDLEEHNERTYNWTIGVDTPIVNVNEVGYASLSTAVLAANAFEDVAETVTIKLLADISDASPMDLTNVNSKPIVLDLNGCTLSTATESFITTDGNLTITDNGLTKGMITSSASKVLVLTSSSADVTLNGCKIVSTKETGSDYYSDAAILMNDSSAKLTVTEATIYTTGGLTTISNRAGSLTISDSEISSGTESTGLIAVCNGLANASTTINSGSFYTSSTTANRPVVYTGSSAGSSSTAGSVTINDGYFYFAGDVRDVRASYSAQNDKITINGGYFAHDLSWTKDPTYGSGKSLQAIEPAETHTHATTGDELSYGYQVKETPIVDVADVNGTTYTSFEDALAAANAYNGADETVTLTLLSDVSVDHATFNHASKNMTLDINGHTLSGTDSAAVRYTVSKTFNIVDNGAVKGKITSTKENVVAKAGSSAATINIVGCTITSSATGSDYYHDAVVYLFNTNATMNITDCVIYSTGSLTAVTVISGTANISGSEISSGTQSTGLVGVCAYNSTASVTINSGCFYTSNTTSTRPAAYAGSGSFTINGGFFYGGATSIRASSASNFESKFTVKGGYFNNQPLFSGHTPTYDGCSLESVSETYTHSIKGTLNFSYQAVSSAGEASVDASTSEPVVTLGEAKTGGVNF